MATHDVEDAPSPRTPSTVAWTELGVENSVSMQARVAAEFAVSMVVDTSNVAPAAADAAANTQANAEENGTEASQVPTGWEIGTGTHRNSHPLGRFRRFARPVAAAGLVCQSLESAAAFSVFCRLDDSWWTFAVVVVAMVLQVAHFSGFVQIVRATRARDFFKMLDRLHERGESRFWGLVFMVAIATTLHTTSLTIAVLRSADQFDNQDEAYLAALVFNLFGHSTSAFCLGAMFAC